MSFLIKESNYELSNKIEELKKEYSFPFFKKNK